MLPFYAMPTLTTTISRLILSPMFPIYIYIFFFFFLILVSSLCIHMGKEGIPQNSNGDGNGWSDYDSDGGSGNSSGYCINLNSFRYFVFRLTDLTL